jgi:hypothetical protein
MAVRLSTGLRTKMLGNSATDGGNGFRSIFKDGIIEIRTGAQPATADAAATGTLLGTVTVASGAFTPGSATNGLEFDAPASGIISKAAAEVWSFNGIATGTAGWFRLKGNALDNDATSTSLPRLDGSIATSGGDMSLSVTAIVTSAPHTVDVFSFQLLPE